jgi:hypothetical protein
VAGLLAVRAEVAPIAADTAADAGQPAGLAPVIEDAGAAVLGRGQEAGDRQAALAVPPLESSGVANMNQWWET